MVRFDTYNNEQVTRSPLIRRQPRNESALRLFGVVGLLLLLFAQAFSALVNVSTNSAGSALLRPGARVNRHKSDGNVARLSSTPAAAAAAVSRPLSATPASRSKGAATLTEHDEEMLPPKVKAMQTKGSTDHVALCFFCVFFLSFSLTLLKRMISPLP